MSSSMLIMSVDKSAILDPATAVRALRRAYGTDEVSDARSAATGWIVTVDDGREPRFQLTLDRDLTGGSINGMPEQNAKAAVALRAELPEQAPRVVAVAPDFGFVDLRWGVTQRQIEDGWRPLSEFEEGR